MNNTHDADVAQDVGGYRKWLAELAPTSPVYGRTRDEWDCLNVARVPITEAQKSEMDIRLALYAQGLSLSHISPDDPESEREKAMNRVFGGPKPDSTIYADSVEVAEGGNVVRLKRRPRRSSIKSGGFRGDVASFSRQSRHRLLTMINSIDRRLVEANRLWFITLTYPGVFPKNPEIWKKHLQAFQKRLKRAFGVLPTIWKMEPQHRGAPHFHLIIFVPPSFCVGLSVICKRQVGKRIITYWSGGQLSDFRQWLSKAWYEVVGSCDERHLRAGTNCEPLEVWDKVVSYTAKYLGKDCVFVTDDGETQAVGRYWGVWNREGFPIHWKHIYVRHDRRVILRRTIRRMYKRNCMPWLNGRDRSATVFIPWETIHRLLNWTDSIVDDLRKEFGSHRRVMRAIGYGGSINDWFESGEKERQQRHRERRGKPALRRLVSHWN